MKKSTYVTWIAWGQFESDDSVQITAQNKFFNQKVSNTNIFSILQKRYFS